MSARQSILRFVMHPRWLTAVRAALILAILFAGWRVGRSYMALFSEWRQLARPTSTPRTAAGQLDSLAAVLPLAGQWSFSELEWNMRTETKSAQDVASMFDSMAKTPAAATDVQLPEVSAEVVKLIDKLQLKPIQQGGNQIYSLVQSDFRAQLILRNAAGKDKTVAFAVACLQPDGNWQLAEFTPRGSVTSNEASTAHLLPLQERARRNSGRFDDQGRLLLELVEVDTNADTIVSTWKNAGWEVRPSGMGDPDDFSYLCARGDEVIYAWSTDSRDALQSLMLVRTPNSADTRSSFKTSVPTGR